ncbi:interferon-induced GTP-binding protein Mx3-like [Triplophysa rosa]|nr:interferon-induced GTP-binding protein Mx3-like [Triplophysa rosa]
MNFLSRFSTDSSASLYERQKMGGELYDHLDENLRPFIDMIDNLRSIGVHKDFNIALPNIVVIGDQSSGKSSVLEALSGVALPRGSGIITRCPLELRLKKVRVGINWKATLSYRMKRIEFVNSSVGTRNREACVRYDPRTITFDDPALVEEHVNTAQNELAGEGAGISDELITLEIMSPDVCDLTLIDLPGIARVPVQGQPPDIGNQIKALILKFITRPETINMVVVPCNVDVATTEALKLAQDEDPEGTRTIAVLTKPDLIDKGTERDILKQVIRLCKGYIMVKCRGQQQIDEDISLEEALKMESDFFENHEHFRCLLTENKATIPHLATELTEQLVSHIKKSLPQLKEEIQKQSRQLRKELKVFEGGPPQDALGAKQFLIKTLSEFNDKIKSLSLGDLIIKDNLFSHLRGEYKKWNHHLNSKMSSFNQSPAEIKKQILKNRGRELAGFSSYRVFEMLLQDHVAELKDPAVILLNAITGIILKQFYTLANECFQRYPALLKITMNKMENIQLSQQSKAEDRIVEQFQMENMICTQDDNYFDALNDSGNEIFSETRLPFCDIATKYSEMLKAYYEIMVRRMSDQMPMLMQYFMLKEASELLCNDMLTLLEQSDVREILSEDSDVSRRRTELQARLERLSTAHEEICTLTDKTTNKKRNI